MNEKLMKHGAFSWFELMTTDVKGAKKFYSELFGWSIKDMPMQDMTYSVVNANGDEVAGIMSMTPESSEMPPTWGVYMTVDDVEETVKKAKSLGGKVLVEPRDIPDVGRFCVIQDPQGAWFEVISYLSK